MKQREEYEKILEKKERKRLLDLKKQITLKPKRPKLLALDVNLCFFYVNMKMKF